MSAPSRSIGAPGFGRVGSRPDYYPDGMTALRMEKPVTGGEAGVVRRQQRQGNFRRERVVLPVG